MRRGDPVFSNASVVDGPCHSGAQTESGTTSSGLACSTSSPRSPELRFLPLAVTLEDYPKAARRAGEEGTSHLSLEVDPSGHIIGFTTARSSGSPALDEQACQLYRTRGRFELLGTTRPATVQAPVQWKLID